MVMIFYIKAKMPVEGQLKNVDIGIVEDWESLKNILFLLLFSLKGAEFEELTIVPLEVETEEHN